MLQRNLSPSLDGPPSRRPSVAEMVQPSSLAPACDWIGDQALAPYSNVRLPLVGTVRED